MRKPRQKKKKRPPTKSKSGFWWCALLLVVGLGIFYFIRPASPPLPPSAPAAISTTNQEQRAPLTDSQREQALHQEAIKAVEQLLADLPGNDDAVYLAGLVHNDKGDTVTATRYWKQSLDLDPTRVDAWDSLGKALLEEDRYEEAEAHFRKAMEIDSTMPEPRLHLAMALSNQGKLEQAVDLLEGTRVMEADGYQLLGEAYQELGQHEKARNAYEQAIRLNPDFMNAYYSLSRICTRLGQGEEASAHWEKFSALREKKDQEARQKHDQFSPFTVSIRTASQAYTSIGRVYAAQRQAAKAEAAWERARALDPDNVFCRVQLAVLFQQTGRKEGALKLYQEITTIDSNDPLAQLNLGHLCVGLYRYKEAEQAFLEVIRLKPERPEGHSALAQLYLQTRRDPRKAVELAQRAAALAPTADNYVVLASAFAASGDSTSAVEAADQAIKLEPANKKHLQLRKQLLMNQK